jgi:hypothetical protein
MKPQDSSSPSSDDSSDLSDLERRLSRLIPAGPAEPAARRLSRHLDSLASQRRESRRIWWRVAPLAAAACVTLFAGLHWKRQLISAAADSRVVQAPVEDPAAVSPRSFVSPPPVKTGIPAENFVPVSSQEFLRQTRPGEVIETGDSRMPAREIRVEYDDAWHWHDPDTRTNIRIFRPREEVILVPIGTD